MVKRTKPKSIGLVSSLFNFAVILGILALYFPDATIEAFRPAPIIAGSYTEENMRLFGFGNSNAGSSSYTSRLPKGETHSLTHKGEVRSWHVYRPDSLTKEPTVVILLHGAGRNGAEMIDMWQSLAQAEGVLLIAPNARSTDGWYWDADGPKFLNAVIADAKTRYDFEGEKVFLFGHSAGAKLAHMLANRTDGPWRAVSSHAGFVAAGNLRQNAGDVPFQIILGDEDHFFPTSAVRTSGQAFAELGHDTVLVSVAGHTHWYYSDAKQINKRAWAFFLSVLETTASQ